MKHESVWRVVLTTAFCVVLLGVAPVRAESPPRSCNQDMHIHPRNGTMPANAPSLVFAPAAFGSVAPPSLNEVEWRAPDDSVVSFTSVAEGSAFLLSPTEVLVPGTHHLRYRDQCNYANPTGIRETSVWVGPAVPLPQSVGTARLRDAFAELSPPSDCMPVNTYVVVDVTMSADFAAYRELARYRVSYRDLPLQMDGYYQPDPPGELDYGNVQGSETVLYFLVRDSCDIGQPRIKGTLKIEAFVAGVQEGLPPLLVEIDAACPTFKYGAPPACSGQDASPASALDSGILESPSRDGGPSAVLPPRSFDAGIGQNPEVKAEVLAIAGADVRPTNGNGGCSTAPNTPARGAWGFGLGVAVAIIMRRQVRRFSA
jgi:MYXO-CTERM domain-containing protein